jgi:hypothetical protein
MERARYLESNNLVGRTVESGYLSAPTWAVLERGCVHWKGGIGGSIKPSPQVLDRFIELWRADSAEILAFAKTNGTLRRPLLLSRTFRKTDSEAREPLSKWRSLSRHAWELLSIAAAIRAGDNLTFEEWTELMSEDRILSGMGSLLALGTQEHRRRSFAVLRSNGLQSYDGQEKWQTAAEHYLWAEVAAWNTKLGPVSFEIERDEDTDSGWKLAVEFGGSMICYIGFQLMLVLAGGDLFTCSACGKPYIRPRGRNAPKGLRKTPKTGERNYCQGEDCIREGNRLAAKRRRERIKIKEETRLPSS